MKMTLLSVYCNHEPYARFMIRVRALARVRVCVQPRNTRRDVFASAVDRGVSAVEPGQVRLSFRFPRASSAKHAKLVGWINTIVLQTRSPFPRIYRRNIGSPRVAGRSSGPRVTVFSEKSGNTVNIL